MRQVDFEAQAARRQLDKILASAGFVRNERLSRFLRFVVERHLEGRDQELKESLRNDFRQQAFWSRRGRKR